MATPPFFREVHRLVRRIPRGKVATYGQIAGMLGRPRAVRAVGTALRRLDGPLARTVPWHRVVNSAGGISRRDREWMDLQRELLEREGMRFTRRGAVDLRQFRWAPRGSRNAASRPQPKPVKGMRPRILHRRSKT